ncbi:MAG: aminoacyl-tRNA hydrolase [Clostridia bacterium]|nr:aminoacyl-tRNA hydrolase [Clostridia bacterium]
MFFKKDFGSGVDFMIVGLGNPGDKYDNTRHNAGFIAIDKIADAWNIRITKLKYKALIGDGTVDGKKVLLMKPQTFMNLSGQAVVEAMNFYKLKPEQVLIIMDDISLDCGKMRIRRKGSAGTHNGMKNIIALSGSDKFPRIKVGVGDKPHPQYDLAAWVLSKFTTDERKLLDECADKSIDAAKLIMNDKIDEAMNRFNS